MFCMYMYLCSGGMCNAHSVEKHFPLGTVKSVYLPLRKSSQGTWLEAFCKVRKPNNNKWIIICYFHPYMQLYLSPTLSPVVHHVIVFPFHFSTVSLRALSAGDRRGVAGEGLCQFWRQTPHALRAGTSSDRFLISSLLFHQFTWVWAYLLEHDTKSPKVGDHL